MNVAHDTRYTSPARAVADVQAARIYGAAGVDPLDRPGAIRLIRALGGDVAVYHGRRELPRGDAVLRRGIRNGVPWWRVEVHGGLPLDVASLALARGLARWYAGAFGTWVNLDELAAAILMPTEAVRRTEEHDVEALAEAFVVPAAVARRRLDPDRVVDLVAARARILARRGTR